MKRVYTNWCQGTTSALMSKATVWKSRQRYVPYLLYSDSVLLLNNILVWLNVFLFYFMDGAHIYIYRNLQIDLQIWYMNYERVCKLFLKMFFNYSTVYNCSLGIIVIDVSSGAINIYNFIACIALGNVIQRLYPGYI